MTLHRFARATLLGTLALALAATLSGCGGGSANEGRGLFGGLFGTRTSAAPQTEQELGAQSALDAQNATQAAATAADGRRSTIWDLFDNSTDPNATIEVNKYLWLAALDVLSFLPIESIDPFTGVIVTGYGTPPGGGRAYRATIYIQDPALDARSLRIAMQVKGGGAVAPETIRAIEDAILTRARQLRIADSNL